MRAIFNYMFKKGYIPWNKGLDWQPKSAFKKGHKTWNKDKKKLPQFSGENNPGWKGEQASYFTKHNWLKRWFGNPPKCENCGKIGQKNKGGKWGIHWALIKGKEYERKRENFRGLCHKCHAIYDLGGKPSWNKGKKNWMSAEGKARMIASKIGKTTWMKGRHHTQETKDKISRTKKLRKLRTKRK